MIGIVLNGSVQHQVIGNPHPIRFFVEDRIIKVLHRKDERLVGCFEIFECFFPRGLRCIGDSGPGCFTFDPRPRGTFDDSTRVDEFCS